MGALVIVVVVILDEAPAIDVDHIALVSHAKHIEAANPLPKPVRDLGGNGRFLFTQFGDIPQLFPMGIASDETVDHGGLSRFGMAEVRPNRVCFDILGIIDPQELFIEIASLRLGD